LNIKSCSSGAVIIGFLILIPVSSQRRRISFSLSG
jgi:hypothetical protein